MGLLEVGLLGSTCLRWVFLSLRFFFLFGWIVLYFWIDLVGFDDFAGIEKMMILRFLIFRF